MRRLSLLALLALLCFSTPLQAQSTVPVSLAADLDPNSFTGMRIEGLVADQQGRLYTIDLESNRLFRIAAVTGAVELMGTLARPATGMAFDRAGNLYMASGELILRIPGDRLNASPFDPGSVQTFATGTPGANGLAFDGYGNLYVSGGDTGTIYAVTPDGTVRTLVNGLVSDREEQRISTNGLQFGTDGRLYSANTGSGAIDRLSIAGDGTAGPVERWVHDPLLLGADGIAFAANGDLYVAANERNAIIRVSPDGTVTEIASNSNNGPLEFPASVAFVGNALYASNFDLPRGANAPVEPGNGASIVRIDVNTPGLALPVSPPGPLPPTATRDPNAPTPPPPPTSVITGPTTAPITGTMTAPDTSTATPVPPTDDTSTAIAETATVSGTVEATPTLPLPPDLIGTPTAAPPARLPDTGAPPASPLAPLILVAMSALAGGLAFQRMRRARR